MKIKWADFRQATRSRSVPRGIGSLESLIAVALDLVQSVYPQRRLGARLVRITLSNFAQGETPAVAAEPEVALGQRVSIPPVVR